MPNDTPTPDPYAPHLRQAEDLFARGEVVKAGQIWQAILKQQPSHAVARERLLALRQHLLDLRAAEDAAPVPVAPAPPSPLPEPEHLIREGCTLYDLGQVSDALQKWEQALGLDPTHALARSYADGARRELGLPPLAALAPTPPPEAAAPAEGEDTDKLLREAVQLYDMGLTEEAISKWERVLTLEPHRTEVEGYLREARREVTQTRSAPASVPALAPALPSDPNAEALELKLRQADHLLGLQRYEEAAFTYQQALGMAPGHSRALAGLERCRRPAPSSPAPQTPLLPLDAQGRIAVLDEDATLIVEPRAVEPPAALLKTAPPPRGGLSLPSGLKLASHQLPWLRNPKVLAAIGGTLLLLIAGSYAVHRHRKEQVLREEVQAARAAAVAPVLQQAQAPDLMELPGELQEEIEATLEVDPLRAYLRAETLVRRHPDQAAGPQLLERARANLPGGATGASLPEFQKHLQNGDLEAAARVMDALLRTQPAEAGLRARAGRLHLALCSAHAAQAKWEEAADDLRRGRALFPEDKTWQARLRLLQRMKALPKAQQAAWLPLLG